MPPRDERPSATRGILASSLTLVGPGRAGRAFARSWRRAGGSVAQVIHRRAPSRRVREELSGASFRSIDSREPFASTDLVVIAVPDDAVAAVARRLARRLSCRFAFHLSGALSSRELRELRADGTRNASLHPLRPFTGGLEEDWTGTFVAVEGDAAAVAVGEAMTRAIGGRPHRLRSPGKPLYHAAASLAAGGTAALLSLAVEAARAAGLREPVAREALAALASRAAEAVRRRPFEEALTGAAARRDVGTVRSHARALRPHAAALLLYRALTEEILRRTPSRGAGREIRQALGLPKGGPDRGAGRRSGRPRRRKGPG